MCSSDPMRPAQAKRRVLFLRHPFASVFFGCPAAGALIWALFTIYDNRGKEYPGRWSVGDIGESLFAGALILGPFFLFPAVLSVIDLVGIFKRQTPESRRIFRIFAILTFVFGTLYSMLYSSMFWDVLFAAPWTEQLSNTERHQPIWTCGLAAVLLLAAVGIAGYCALTAVRIDRMPPLAIALSIAAMYLGMVPAVIWCLQIALPVFGIGQHTYACLPDLLMCLLPADCVILMISLLRDKIHEWNERPAKGELNALKESLPQAAFGAAPLPGTVTNGRVLKGFSQRCRILAKLDQWLEDSANWPLGGLLLALPLLGLCLALLALFGQFPDRFVRAWTQTADWGLSQKIPPQNAFYDEHYLCTVAAGGHKEVVRPMRYGQRHGRRVVVNRQLCVANAFEQLLEERTPRFHRRLRQFYDTCGYPLSRLIRTKRAADAVWLLMKPLEWAFLFVLYLFDASPENRIAVQYMPRR